ncbi:conserved hypothetical protein [Neisseria gonorrhoeae DGI2]|nr:conserved hypothetical protein [Neisseria gonorrhoeae DGI2]KMY24698.1 hypothetical protein NGDG_00536 [Neisseria gonorrhoeae FA6140]
MTLSLFYLSVGRILNLLIFSIKIRKFIVRCHCWQSYHVLLLMEA